MTEQQIEIYFENLDVVERYILAAWVGTMLGAVTLVLIDLFVFIFIS